MPNLHTGEVQGSIPCAPTKNQAKSNDCDRLSRTLCPENIGAQQGTGRKSNSPGLILKNPHREKSGDGSQQECRSRDVGDDASKLVDRGA
jgi:hypothetical protein